MNKIEDFIKHGSHCLAGKYSTMGRCNCGAQAALEELAALRKAAQQSANDDGVIFVIEANLTDKTARIIRR